MSANVTPCNLQNWRVNLSKRGNIYITGTRDRPLKRERCVTSPGWVKSQCGDCDLETFLKFADNRGNLVISQEQDCETGLWHLALIKLKSDPVWNEHSKCFFVTLTNNVRFRLELHQMLKPSTEEDVQEYYDEDYGDTVETDPDWKFNLDREEVENLIATKDPQYRPRNKEDRLILEKEKLQRAINAGEDISEDRIDELAETNLQILLSGGKASSNSSGSASNSVPSGKSSGKLCPGGHEYGLGHGNCTTKSRKGRVREIWSCDC